ANPNQRGDAVDVGAGAADENRSKAMIETRTQRRTKDTEATGVRRRWRHSACLSFVAFVTFVSSALAANVSAQMSTAPAAASFKREPGTPASQVPPALREIGFDQRLDEQLPLSVPLRDEAGRGGQLSDYFGKRPLVRVFAYYDCPMLCTLAINGLSSALKVLSLNPGVDF